MIKETLLFGAGGHAKVVMESLFSNGSKSIKLFDDDSAKFALSWLGYRIEGGRSELISFWKKHAEQCQGVIVTIGDNHIRQKIYNEFAQTDLSFASEIHANAVIADSVKLGDGLMIMAGVVINPDTHIGNNVIINTGAIIEHDIIIEDHVHIAPNATLCGGVNVGELTLIGAGAIVLPGVKIGKHCIIGAGAVVIEDVADGATVIGAPAKRIG
jgi:UDP-perosamine 4-acetyltransferase